MAYTAPRWLRQALTPGTACCNQVVSSHPELCRKGWGAMAHLARYAVTAPMQQPWPERPCGHQVFARGASARWPTSLGRPTRHQPSMPRPAPSHEHSAPAMTASISSEVLTQPHQEHPSAPYQRQRRSQPNQLTQHQSSALQTTSLPQSHVESGLGASAAADAPTALGRRQWGMSVLGAALAAATSSGEALG